MDVISIVNGNVCGRFRDVLARKVLFSAGTLTSFHKSLSDREKCVYALRPVLTSSLA
jgi:hypothetical protein